MSRDLYGSIDEAIRRTQTTSNDLNESIKDRSQLGLSRHIYDYLNSQMESLKGTVTGARYVSEEEFDPHDERVWGQVKLLQDDMATATQALERAKQAFAKVTPPKEDSK